MAGPAFSEQPLEGAGAHSGGDGGQAPHEPGARGGPGPGGEDTSGAGGPREEDRRDLRAEVTQLRRAMRTRPPIDKSMGVLMAAYGLSEDEAWEVLVTASQHTNTKLYTVAEEIVASTQGDVVNAGLRETIEAALKKLKKLKEPRNR